MIVGALTSGAAGAVKGAVAPLQEAVGAEESTGAKPEDTQSRQS